MNTAIFVQSHLLYFQLAYLNIDKARQRGACIPWYRRCDNFLYQPGLPF